MQYFTAFNNFNINLSDKNLEVGEKRFFVILEAPLSSPLGSKITQPYYSFDTQNNPSTSSLCIFPGVPLGVPGPRQDAPREVVLPVAPLRPVRQAGRRLLHALPQRLLQEPQHGKILLRCF